MNDEKLATLKNEIIECLTKISVLDMEIEERKKQRSDLQDEVDLKILDYRREKGEIAGAPPAVDPAHSLDRFGVFHEGAPPPPSPANTMDAPGYITATPEPSEGTAPKKRGRPKKEKEEGDLGITPAPKPGPSEPGAPAPLDGEAPAEKTREPAIDTKTPHATPAPERTAEGLAILIDNGMRKADTNECAVCHKVIERITEYRGHDGVLYPVCGGACRRGELRTSLYRRPDPVRGFDALKVLEAREGAKYDGEPCAKCGERPSAIWYGGQEVATGCKCERERILAEKRGIERVARREAKKVAAEVATKKAKKRGKTEGGKATPAATVNAAGPTKP